MNKSQFEGLDSEEYQVLYNKFLKINNAILPEEHNEDKGSIALCFTEIASQSKALINMIEKIAEVDMKLSNNDLDELLGDLVNAKIVMYDELRCWMRQLRRPLQNLLDAITDKLPDDDEE